MKKSLEKICIDCARSIYHHSITDLQKLLEKSRKGFCDMCDKFIELKSLKDWKCGIIKKRSNKNGLDSNKSK